MTVCLGPNTHTLSGDLVVCDGPSSLAAHKGIFNFNIEAYIKCDMDSLLSTINEVIEDAVNKPAGSFANLHLAIQWESLFVISLWTKDVISVQKAYLLLRDAGMAREEIEPFVNSSLLDLFPSLYYSKRFDVMRRLCSMAKKKLESRFPKMGGRILCHLVAKDDRLIAASSL